MRMSLLKTKFFFALVISSMLGFGNLCHAQYENDYTPRSTQIPNADQLIKSSKEQVQFELAQIKSRSKSKISKAYRTSAKKMYEGLTNDNFIYDDTIQVFVERVFNKIILANQIDEDNTPGRILILRNPRPGAFCMGDGTITVTIGLLSILDNESQLAFILSHETAHFTQNHIRDNVKRNIESAGEKKEMFEEQLDKMVNGRIDLEGMDSLKTMVYSGYKFSRVKEKESDALGIEYMNRAGYDISQSTTILAKLDETTQPKTTLGIEILNAFNFSKYPLQEHWLRPRANIYHTKRVDPIFDSKKIRTHPEMEERLAALDLLISENTKIDLQEDHFKNVLNRIVSMAEFEVIQAAYDRKAYDIALHRVLLQKINYPKNTYINTMIAQILIDVVEKSNQSSDNIYARKPIPLISQGYNEEEIVVNDFLHTLSKKELPLIAFHFMNNKSVFDPNCEKHYYLLWKIGKLTNDQKLVDQVSSSYSKKFENGEYAKMMAL